MPDALAEREYWERHWASLVLPVAYDLENSTGAARAILGFFEGALASRTPRTVLEIGGAPGGFLAHFARRYGSEIYAIDYSVTGCRKTEENFRILGLPVTVYQRDLFAVETGFPKFDLVYSMGFIEHFADTSGVVKAHRELMRPDGLLILGVPHFVRVFWPVLSLLAPRVTRGHNYKALALENWAVFERSLGLRPLRKSYVGGFSPGLMATVICEERRLYGGRLWPAGESLVFALRLAAALRRRVGCMVPARLGSALRIEGKGISSFGLAAYSTSKSDASYTTEIGTSGAGR